MVFSVIHELWHVVYLEFYFKWIPWACAELFVQLLGLHPPCLVTLERQGRTWQEEGGPFSIHFPCWGNLGMERIWFQTYPGESEGTDFNFTFCQVRGKAGLRPSVSLLSAEPPPWAVMDLWSHHSRLWAYPVPNIKPTALSLILLCILGLSECGTLWHPNIFFHISVLMFKLLPGGQDPRAESWGENNKGKGNYR